MKASRSRRGRGKPFGVGAPRRRGRGKPRATHGAPVMPTASPEAAPPAAAEPDQLVAAVEERIVADQDAPPPAPSPTRTRHPLWAFALPIVLLVIAGGVAWYFFLGRPLPPAGEQAPGATTAVDIVELKQLLRRLDFPPGPDNADLDPATREAIRQFQHTAGLPETGEPSAALLDELQQVVAPLKAN